MTTPYQAFMARWAKGCGAECCRYAKRIVHCRGVLPCDVLFVGEAPGESEDVIGRPFVGPAGKLLDNVVLRSLGVFNQARASIGLHPLDAAYANLVGCIPRDRAGGPALEPDADAITSCGPRLTELAAIGQPSVLVCVGTMSRDWLNPAERNPAEMPASVKTVIDIAHPAAILRANISNRGLMAQRAAARIVEALEDAFPVPDGARVLEKDGSRFRFSAR